MPQIRTRQIIGALLITCLLGFSLAGCGGSSGSSQPAEQLTWDNANWDEATWE